ncbi:nucleolar and coiled-body phosphoprotein 1-like, partial [Heptranchias perlo]|uniref:nucleolar and coiled-body phosphoprotein 1-like n=1 Tax=Heptranchias perlo TaxID=212740 RepID=UPI003559CD71
MASLDAEGQPNSKVEATADPDVLVLESSPSSKINKGTSEAAETAPQKLGQASSHATGTGSVMGNVASQNSKEPPSSGTSQESGAEAPETDRPEAAAVAGIRGEESGSRETQCKSAEPYLGLEPPSSDTVTVSRPVSQPGPLPVKGLPGHAAKTFPVSPTKALGANRAKMTLTGISKSPNSIQSLAMKLLSVPTGRAGNEVAAVPVEAHRPIPAPDEKPKVHKARKSISRPGISQRLPTELGSLPCERACQAPVGTAEAERTVQAQDENQEVHRARKSILKGSFSQSLSRLPTGRAVDDTAGGTAEAERAVQGQDENQEIHRARKSILKGSFSQGLAKKMASMATGRAVSEVAAETEVTVQGQEEYQEVHRARKSLLATSISQSLAKNLPSETIGRAGSEVSTVRAEEDAPQGQEEKPKIHRARKSMFKPSPAQVKLVEKKADSGHPNPIKQSTQPQLEFLPGGVADAAAGVQTGLVKRRKAESLGPEPLKKISLLKEEMAKEPTPLGSIGGGPGAKIGAGAGPGGVGGAV